MNRLKELRESRNLSQHEVAKLAGVDVSTISRIESGARKISAEQTKALSEVFAVTADYMLGIDPPVITFPENPRNRLRDIRISKGLTLRGLGNAVQIDHATLANIERNSRAMTVKNLIKLCKFFGVTADYMLGLDEQNERRKVTPEYPQIDKPDRNYFRKNQLGYVEVYMPESAMATKSGWVLLHRIVMAKSIGRDLRPEEVVHHIDGDPGNNALSNLMLFPNNAEHRRYHGIVTRDNQIEELLKK